jgi:uncharacterized membrane protein
MAKNKPPGNQNPSPNQQPRIVSQTQQWVGPLPPPGALDQFNQIIPNGAERIMRMVEQEQEHRIAHDQKALFAATRDTQRGHWIGGTISIAAILGAAYTAVIGAHPVVSAALVGVPLFAAITHLFKKK